MTWFRRGWIIIFFLFGCDDGRGRPPAPDGGGDAARADAALRDGGPDASFDGGPDASFDAGRDARSDAGFDVGVDSSFDGGFDSGVDAGSLDPLLDTADPSGATCSTPGSLGECPSLEVCRFFDGASGRCETCDGCGNLNDPCSDGRDCDILFACYAGRCTNICPLGTSFCGPPDDCLNVGHPTHGVCRP